MRSLQLYIATSIDGKIARSDGSIDWLPDPFAEDYGYDAFYAGVDTVLMGYQTYETSLSFGDWPYPGKETFVFSRDRNKTVIPEATLVHDDMIAFVRQLKEASGRNIWLIGGGSVIAQLHDAGLIDRYILAVVPHIVGAGIELFPGIVQEAGLKLSAQRVYGNGVVMLHLDRSTGADK